MFDSTQFWKQSQKFFFVCMCKIKTETFSPNIMYKYKKAHFSSIKCIFS